MRVTFVNEDQTIYIEERCTIQEAAVRAGIQPEAPCGGKGICKKCRAWIEGEPEAVLACQTFCREGMRIRLENPKRKMQILETFSEKTGSKTQIGAEEEKTSYVAAFDIGTTTVAAYLLDRQRGTVLERTGDLNPQIQHGADVISRIEFAVQGHAELLRDEIRDAVNRLLESLARMHGIKVEEIKTVSVAGNTCMHHFFLGVPTDSLVRIPYRPALYKAQNLRARDLAIRIHPEGRLLTFPNIAGFVGGDTVACLLSADFVCRRPMTLLIDIGTNGEMVLGNAARRAACSTAAGPALEGARISCGMRGAAGAIDHVWLENGEVSFSVIGGGKPRGICGSGLLDAAAVLLELSVIDESGAFLTEDKEYHFSEKVSLTQRDIRELQLAKAAIAAGIRILCKYMEIRLEDIEEVLIAGAFGNYMNPDSACKIGLIPPILRKRVKMIGNAAGKGSCQMACKEEAYTLSARLAEETEFLELASDMDFQDVFVEELSFEE